MIPIKLKNSKDTLDEHWIGMKSLFRNNAHKTVIKNWIRNHGLTNILGEDESKQIQNLIIASPKQLKSIIAQLGNNPNLDLQEMMEVKYQTFRTRKDELYTASDLIQNIEVTVCPYCNRTFISSIKRTNGRMKTTCQLDHFYPKNRYPILALSFYNLIPSCASCNHIKTDNTEQLLSPYEMKDSTEGLQFKMAFTNEKNGYDLENLIIELNPTEQFKNNITTFELEALYEKHADIANEIWQKGRIYSKERITELLKEYPELFQTEAEIKQMIMGNYLEEEDLGKRPLAKLTRDIAREVKFIK